MKSFITFFILLFFIITGSIGANAEVIHVPKSALSTETKTMNFLIDNYFIDKDMENPRVRKKIEDNIKRLNPHIKDWNYLQDETSIFYEKKSPQYDVSLGGGTSYFEDDYINSNSNYFSILTEMDYYIHYRYFAFLDLKFAQYGHSVADSNYTYEKSSTLSFEIGMAKILKNPWWQCSLSLQKEKIGTLSTLLARPGVVYSQDELYRDIVRNSTLEFLWFRMGIEYQFNFYKIKKEGALYTIYGFALNGELSVKEYGVSEPVTAHRFDLGYKQSLYNNWWGKLNLRQSFLYSTKKLTHSLFEFSTGLTF